jgi:hypothetical protein
MARDCVWPSPFLGGLEAMDCHHTTQLEKQKSRSYELRSPQASSGTSHPHHIYIIRVNFIKYWIIVDMKIYICLNIYHSIHN